MDHCQREHLRPGGFGDLIYQAADAGEISHEQAPMLVRSFLSAGVDTTVNGIGNALFCLAQHPDQYARLHADPSLARPAFEEALRCESTVQTFFRTTARDAEIAGVDDPGRQQGAGAAWPRPTATARNGRNPSATTSAAGRAATWPSAPASTAASARWSPGSKAKWS